MFDKMKQLYEMQKQAKEMQKTAEGMKIAKSGLGGKINLVMNGSFKVESLSIDSSLLAASNQNALEKSLIDVINEAVADAGKQSAAQAMAMMKDLNIKLPGF